MLGHTSRPPARPAADMFVCQDEGPITYLYLPPRDELPDAAPDGRIDELWQTLDAVAARNQKVLVFRLARDLAGTRNMKRFWARVECLSADYGRTDRGWSPMSHRTLALQQEENAFRRFIEAMTRMDTFVMCVLEGEVMLPFLGMALACDYRLVTEDTVIVNHSLSGGFPACGAVAWFLVRHVGHGRAAHLLMEREAISAREAFDLALVDRLVAAGDLEKEVRTCAEGFARTPGRGLATMKRLLAASGRELDAYLDAESATFERWLSGRESGT